MSALAPVWWVGYMAIITFELPSGQATHYLLKFPSSITPGLVGAQDGPLDVPDPGVVGGV